MQYEEKLQLLKAIPLLGALPERQLTGLAKVLRLKSTSSGDSVFEEGSVGMSLYFISKGKIRITMRADGLGSSELATLGSGEFFGESALIAESFRSASAIALGDCVLFELFRGDLDRWTKSNPQQAVQFFAGLLNAQSERLRRTSRELVNLREQSKP